MSDKSIARAYMRALTLALWMPTLAMSATLQGIGDSLGALTWPVAIALFCLSTVSGITSLAVQLDRMLADNPARLQHPVIFALSRMLASWVAGLIAALGALSSSMSAWAALGLVIAASFSGAHFIQLAVSRMFGGINLGGAPAPPPPAPPGNQIMGGQQP